VSYSYIGGAIAHPDRDECVDEPCHSFFHQKEESSPHHPISGSHILILTLESPHLGEETTSLTVTYCYDPILHAVDRSGVHPLLIRLKH